MLTKKPKCKAMMQQRMQGWVASFDLASRTSSQRELTDRKDQCCTEQIPAQEQKRVVEWREDGLWLVWSWQRVEEQVQGYG